MLHVGKVLHPKPFPFQVHFGYAFGIKGLFNGRLVIKLCELVAIGGEAPIHDPIVRNDMGPTLKVFALRPGESKPEAARINSGYPGI